MKRSVFIIFSVFMVFAITILVVGSSRGLAASEVKASRSVYEIQGLNSVMGTASYSLGLAMEEVCKKNHPWLRPSSIETGGNVYNIRTIVKGDESVKKHSAGCMTIGELSMVAKGVDPFKDCKSSELSFLNVYCVAAGTFVTLDPKIKTMADLKGKKIALGKRTQAFWGINANMLLEHGFGLKDGQNVNAQWVGDKVGVDALRDGLVDAFFTGGYSGIDEPRTFIALSSMQELVVGKKVYYLDATVDGVNKTASGTDLPLTPLRLPAGTWQGQDKDVHLLAITAGWGVHNMFPEDVAYEWVKVLLAHREKFAKYHAIGKTWTSNEFFVYGVPTKVFHPGALKAFREAGIIK